ncbi:competence type IV pilus assembly protein ComGB [Streptococcus saliviloxodontae]|uniref:competence type IV pilus assembly protein ComGB n=1 Tax=Streptococcus saliviloxodontae TaxID=1349416 RepID=UPI001EF8A5B9|nr:competence type IV pilus assembly protein ComGB [Streptococcus saliviloxodontae]
MSKINSKTIQQKNGIAKLTAFLQKDISLGNKHRAKKLAIKRQRKVIQLFNNLMASGFNLTEILTFLERSQLLEDSYIQRMRKVLLNGQGLPEMMSQLGFSDSVVTQLSLADVHGNTHQSLQKIESYLAHLSLVRKKVIEVATYPLCLLTFLVLIMLGLKNYLLPQLDGKGNAASLIINHFPMIFLTGIATLLITSLLLIVLARRLSPVLLYSRLARLPFIGYLVRLYLTAYYAREWGNLIGQGVELVAIVRLMQEQKSKLFQAIGEDMEAALLAGRTFHEKVLDYPFFLRELSLMIEYGEVKSKLGSELEIYAEETWERFFTRMTQATQLIQPLVFLLVAVMIVLIYAAMLLPMYQSMEVLS